MYFPGCFWDVTGGRGHSDGVRYAAEIEGEKVRCCVFRGSEEYGDCYFSNSASTGRAGIYRDKVSIQSIVASSEAGQCQILVHASRGHPPHSAGVAKIWLPKIWPASSWLLSCSMDHPYHAGSLLESAVQRVINSLSNLPRTSPCLGMASLADLIAHPTGCVKLAVLAWMSRVWPTNFWGHNSEQHRNLEYQTIRTVLLDLCRGYHVLSSYLYQPSSYRWSTSMSYRATYT